MRRTVGFVERVRAAHPGRGDQRRHLARAGGPGGVRGRRRRAQRRVGRRRPRAGRRRSGVRRRASSARTPGESPRGPARTGSSTPTWWPAPIADTTAYAERALAAGVARESIVIDPAHDFGKTTRDSPRPDPSSRRDGRDRLAGAGLAVQQGLRRRVPRPAGRRAADRAPWRRARSPRCTAPASSACTRWSRPARSSTWSTSSTSAAPAGARDPGPCVTRGGVIDTVLVLPSPRALLPSLSRGRPRRPSCGPPARQRSAGCSPTRPTGSSWSQRPSSEANRARGVVEPLGHRVARHLLGDAELRGRSSPCPTPRRSLLEQRPRPSSTAGGDGRRLGQPRREGARSPAPGRGRLRRRASSAALRAGDVEALAAHRPRAGAPSSGARARRASTSSPRWPAGAGIAGRGELRRRAVRRRLVGRPVGPEPETRRAEL